MTDRPTALAHLAATAAAPNRLQGRQPNPATTSDREQHAHQQQCRTAGAALRTAVANAHHAGIPIDTIAATAGFSPGYVQMILQREHTHEPNPHQPRLASAKPTTPDAVAAPALCRADTPTAAAPSHVGPIRWAVRSADDPA
ncbi:hypothetical protein [Embleya sp. AB8]|uniref:hypothetical protein n=1 Tax=Embleya sp. AB8 TaxID=3156304 RepID=UPI003C75C03B